MRRAQRSPASSWVVAATLAFATLWPTIGDLAARTVTGEGLACAVPCEGSDEDGHCPPHCTDGSCAKIVLAAPHTITLVLLPVTRRIWPIRALQVIPFEPQPQGIFRPPRA